MIDITTNVQEVIRKFKALPGHLERAGLKTLKDASEAVTKLMKRPGLPVRRPIHWDTDRQRGAYFASRGFGKGIPYQRTGGYVNAWQSKAIAGGYQTENIGHQAVFLSGTPSGNMIGQRVSASGQSHIHAGRWQLVKPVVEFVLSKLPERLLKALNIETKL